MSLPLYFVSSLSGRPGGVSLCEALCYYLLLLCYCVLKTHTLSLTLFAREAFVTCVKTLCQAALCEKRADYCREDSDDELNDRFPGLEIFYHVKEIK